MTIGIIARRHMDVRELIERRLTVHEYAERPLPPGTLTRALEAAVSAPNHRLTEPWRFIQVGPRTRESLLAIGLDLATQRGARELSEHARSRLAVTVRNPSELLVVAQALDESPDIRREDYAA